MKILRILLIVFVLMFVSSCFCESLWEWLFPDDKPTLEQKRYEGENLRIDGFYCYDSKDDYYDHTTKIFVFYRNGIVMGGVGTYYSKVYETYNSLIEEQAQGYYADVIDWWGLFEIEDSIIRLEYYLPSMYGHHTYLMQGTILNDTTFHMIKGKQSDKSDYETIDYLYSFHKTEAKPDSTNKFFR
ncbi:MAG: hypothetical protein J6T18_04935 [Bacteroidaceae bacterium]|nr:hypothetical protein [Bacteroidaceae bacterium]